MKNLSVKELRKIIIEEIKKMMIQDDALFSREELTNTGTGTIVGLDTIEDDDWYTDYDNSATQCSVCGGDHEPHCQADSEEDEFVGYVLSNN